MIGLIALLACAPKAPPPVPAAAPQVDDEVIVILEFENAPAVDLAHHLAVTQGRTLFVDPTLRDDAPMVDASHIGPPDGVIPSMAAALAEHDLVLEASDTTLLLYRSDSETLVRHPPVDRPGCGDGVTDLAPYEQSFRLVPVDDPGVRVFAVGPGSAAAGLGLKNGDVLHRVGDWTGDQPPEGAFVALEAAAQPGVTTEFELVRRGQPVAYACRIVSLQTP